MLTVWSLALGSFLSASVLGSTTLTVTSTVSVEPSGYVTTTLPGLSPAVVVSIGVSNSTLVPSGKSFKFSIESSALGVSPMLTVWSLALGSFLSASVNFLTVNLNSSVTGLPSTPITGLPSLPRTATVTVDSPSFVGIPVIWPVAGS